MNPAGGTDLFTVAYDATTPTSTTNRWAIRQGGTDNTVGYGIATDGTRVYVTGGFAGSATIAGQALTATYRVHTSPRASFQPSYSR